MSKTEKAAARIGWWQGGGSEGYCSILFVIQEDQQFRDSRHDTIT